MLGLIPKIDVVSVAASATLATLLGAPLQSSTTRVYIRPHAAGVYMANGTADANDAPLETMAMLLEGGPAELGAIEFYAAGQGLDMTVIQNGVICFADLPAAPV